MREERIGEEKRKGKERGAREEIKLWLCKGGGLSPLTKSCMFPCKSARLLSCIVPHKVVRRHVTVNFATHVSPSVPVGRGGCKSKSKCSF